MPKPVNSNRKGKVGERKAAEYLRSLGFTDARRTQQYNGEGKSDVICPDSLPGLHIEVKYGYPIARFDLCTRLFRDAVEQARRDSGGNWWIVLWKPARHQIWRLSFGHDGVATIAGDEDIKNYLEICKLIHEEK